MSERRGTKGLELWCRRMTEGYPDVKIDNMTTSWRDGLAFCALIHHFRPDLIDFTKLNKNDIYHNNELAFRIAEIHLGIPALLEPEDMVEFAVPDRLSILTYLSQFYQTFTGPQGSSQARIAPKRPQSPPDHNIVSPPSTSPPSKVAFLGAGKIRRDPCAKCGLPVFIAERLNVEKLLYHRTCFRCARCNSQLTLDNYYATENGDFCCETCPDEEKPLVTKVEGQEEQSVLTRSMSDEQKTANLRVVHDDQDEYSAEFETALEFPQDSSLKRNSSLTSEQTAVFTEARTHFMLTQMESGSESDNEDNVPPDLPTVEKPVLTSGADSNSELFDVQFDSGFSNNNIKVESVNIESNNKNNSDSLTADITENIVTKDVVTADETPPTSMVKARLQLFESNVANSRNKVTKSDDFNKEKPIEFIDEEDSSTLDIKQQNNEDSVLESSDNKTNPEQISPQNITTDTSVITILDSSEEERKINEEFVDDKQDNTTETSIITVLDSSEETAKETVPVKTEPETKSQNTEEDYPVDLNPFGDDDEDDKANASKDSLNPFDEVPEKLPPIPSPRAKKRIIPSSEDKEITGSPECLATIYIERISVNPFESDEEEDVVKVKPPLPANRKKRVLEAPKISLNPFWESGEENEEEVKQPVPTPRSSRNTMDLPRDSGLEGSSFGSSNSLSSGSNFSGGTLRKKKPAPKPPVILTESSPSSLTSSPSQSVQHSPCATLKYRKAKKAPLPPGFASTPIEGKKINEGLRISLSSLDFDSQKLFASNLSPQSENLEVEKNTKDEVNRNRQSQIPINSPSSSENSLSLGAPNKSTYGKWKRRKGLAPSRPVPQKRTIKSLPVEDISKELGVIEIQLQGLERQGVRIEQIIREKCEGSENDEQTETSLPADAEDLILQLFELVNEKNELFRKQAELMYLKRQQRLEEEHADVEYQIRCLMLQPEANKTDSDKAREEELINRLVDIVERRNEIVECLEMDRVREAEEDHSITNHLNLYSMRMSEDKTPELPSSKKEKKKHKKEKRFKFKGSKIDADKDIDESETGSSQSSTEKKKKKKLILFK